MHSSRGLGSFLRLRQIVQRRIDLDASPSTVPLEGAPSHDRQCSSYSMLFDTSGRTCSEKRNPAGASMNGSAFNEGFFWSSTLRWLRSSWEVSRIQYWSRARTM